MFNESFFVQITQASGTILLFTIALFLLTLVYLPFYKITRKCSELQLTESFWLKTGLTICLYLFLGVIWSLCDSFGRLLIPVLGITAGTDIFIRKIPSEFLVIFLFLSLQNALQNSIAIRILISALVFVLWFQFKNKLGMGTYDILLVSILTLNCSSFSAVLLFCSAILFLWGVTGFILQRVFDKAADIKIPLAPIIIIAFIPALIIP